MQPADRPNPIDIAIVGGGAAGLATAIFTARRGPNLRIAVLDGARKIGAKILVSGGGRCNVTNERITEGDYFGGSRRVIGRILDALPVAETVAFFREIGVPLHREDDGKLFPNTNAARSVVDALLAEARRLHVDIRTEQRVVDVAPALNNAVSRETSMAASRTGGPGFTVSILDRPPLPARRIVLATGGLSLPKTGSDGGGYALARGLGHSIVATTPALAPLILDGRLHADLAGVTHDAELTVDGERDSSQRGSLLWTHQGISGPAPMNLSRIFHRAALTSPVGGPPIVRLNLLPGLREDELDQRLTTLAAETARQAISRVLSDLAAGHVTGLGRAALGHDPSPAPPRVVERLLAECGIETSTPMAHLSRDARRRAAQAACGFDLRVAGSRGYAAAEATAGGVPLTEIHAGTMESRVRRGLFLVGEILDVDGRIGGFNFQWAWSGAAAAARGLAEE